MRKNLVLMTALLMASVVLLPGSAARTPADNPRQAAIDAAARAKSAVEAAKEAPAAAEKARNNKGPDLDKKEKAEEDKFEQAQAALKAAQQALAAIPEGHDLTTRKRVGDQLDELDAILQVLGFIEPNALQRRLSSFPPDDAKGKKEAQEAINNAFEEAEKAINKLPPEKRKDLQKQIEDRQKELLDKLALGGRLGKANDTYASLEGAGRVTDREGLKVVTFDTLQGRVIVNLPDDMRAGDTISGTVVAEPKGNTNEERAKNMSPMGDQKVKIATASKPDGTSDVNVVVPITATASPFTFKLPPATPDPFKSVSSSNSAGLGITLTNTTGSLTIGPTQTVPIELVSLSLQSVAPITVHQLPTIGQKGRPIEIIRSGGNSQNITLNWTKVRSTVQDFEKNTENVSGGFGLIDGNPIAASPRKAVFLTPTNVTGLIEITLKEGDKETKGTFRNVGVNLSAPKTNLHRGERTELRVEVNGLEGLKQPVPLTLESHGVITMEGGNYQQLLIQPSQVDQNGNYITTREVTGVQTGVWEATVTVVTQPFNVCLQDDNNAQTVLLINSFTGVYTFSCEGCSSADQNVGNVVGGVGQATGPGTGTGTVTIKGCTINLEHNAPDRHVKAQIDQCAKTGSASVQTSAPKMKFTITDRNTTNNTCVCGPGCK